MTLVETAPTPAQIRESTTPTKRLLSLDAFRGLTIATMILVNNPGDWSNIYAPLKHAEWHGCTPTDLVFPFFLFIVGVAIPFAQAARLKRLQPGQTRAALVPAIVRRSLILFLLGFAIAAIPLGANSGILNWQDLRIMGVLQRIGICYFFAAMLGLFARPRAHVAVAVLLVVAYSVLMLLVPVPGHGRGDLSRGHNLAAYVDTQVFGRHVWVKPPPDAPGQLGWEPEGLLSTIPAIATTLLGLLTGQWLRTNRNGVEKVAAVLAFGVFGAALGYVLDRTLMPINKGLWTPSYVVYTAGLALLALGACYWLIDVSGYRAWSRPLVIFGMNAIAIFVLSGIVGRLMGVRFGGSGTTLKGLVYNNVYKSLGLAPVDVSLLYALTWVTVMFGIAWVMYRLRVFIKV
jgi:predicted acyltransferase